MESLQSAVEVGLGLGGKQQEPLLLGPRAFASLGCSPRFSGLDSSGPLSRTGGQCLLIEILGTGPEPSLAEVRGGPPPPEAGPVSGKPASQKAPDFFTRKSCLLCSQKKAGKLFSSGMGGKKQNGIQNLTSTCTFKCT